MTEYGLPDVRDPDSGELQAVDHSYTFDGQDVTIQLVPPTISQFEEYEQMGTDVDVDELFVVVDEHLVKPEIDRKDATVRELTCYLQGIIDYGVGGGSNFMQGVRRELEERDGGPGN
jgi:hypothetical protein